MEEHIATLRLVTQEVNDLRKELDTHVKNCAKNEPGDKREVRLLMQLGAVKKTEPAGKVSNIRADDDLGSEEDEVREITRPKDYGPKKD